jgi:SAM-dependent methyltransferase
MRSVRRPEGGGVRAVARKVGRVPKEYLEYRFDTLTQVVREEAERVRSVTATPQRDERIEDALREAAVLAGRQYSRSEAAADRLTAAVQAYEQARGAAEEQANAQRALAEQAQSLLAQASQMPRRGTELTDRDRSLLNYASGHEGFAAQADLWFNPPLSLAYTKDRVVVADVNERIGEVPFVFRNLHGVPSGARVLDVGAAESTVALSLASLGYHVTALDPRGYPLSHPNLKVSQNGLEDLPADDPYDVIICLSTIEHLGIGSYALDTDADLDVRALQSAKHLLEPDGLLILTTPCASSARVDALQRVYDEEGLQRLLEGWDVLSKEYLVRSSRTSWTREGVLPRDTVTAAALICARPCAPQA